MWLDQGNIECSSGEGGEDIKCKKIVRSKVAEEEPCTLTGLSTVSRELYCKDPYILIVKDAIVW